MLDDFVQPGLWPAVVIEGVNKLTKIDSRESEVMLDECRGRLEKVPATEMNEIWSAAERQSKISYINSAGSGITWTVADRKFVSIFAKCWSDSSPGTLSLFSLSWVSMSLVLISPRKQCHLSGSYGNAFEDDLYMQRWQCI